MSFDPSRTYVILDAGGRATETPGGNAFWSLPPEDLAKFGQGWLVSEFECTADWSNWEMHPNADEYVYLLSGSVTMLLEFEGGNRKIPLVGRAAVVVPKGIWHTAKVAEPSRMLFVTMGSGTKHRSAGAMDGDG